MILESLKERPIPLLKNKLDKRALLHGKDWATVGQVKKALKRKEVSVPTQCSFPMFIFEKKQRVGE